MIRKLRRRFILINMALVSVVLIALFVAICVSSYRSLIEDSSEAMHHTMIDFRRQLRTSDSTVMMLEIHEGENRDTKVLVSCVWIDERLGFSNVRYYIADESMTQDDLLFVAGTALRTGETDGILTRQNLRWQQEPGNGGMIFAFVDRTNEIAVMSDLIRNCILIGITALAAFFLISVFLVRLMMRPVENAWEQQRQFIADASHELKTPLTVILANAEILQAHPDETIESQQKWLGYIAEETKRMRQLVEDMLFLAKADAASEKEISMRFDLSDLILSCLLSFEPVAFEKGIHIESDIEPELIIEGNAGNFRQLCMILLDNACKYTNENGVIHIELVRTLDKIRFSVHNTGTPIPKESLPHLFERFYRADSSRTREEGGYGLGLSIAQKIVQSFRGRITAESNESGNTFAVTVPNRETLLENMKHK